MTAIHGTYYQEDSIRAHSVLKSSIQPCAADHHEQKLLNDNVGYRLARQIVQSGLRALVAAQALVNSNVITIPVVVHIVHQTPEMVTDEQVQSQMIALERDFHLKNLDEVRRLVPLPWADRVGNPNVRFFLTRRDAGGQPSNGITRRKTDVPGFHEKGKDDDRVKSTKDGGSDPWDPNRFLNIWVCNLEGIGFSEGDKNINLLGYAQFPGAGHAIATDGVVIHHQAFGSLGTAGPRSSYAEYGLGRTAVHEIGHYLGLKHIWGDRNDGSGDDGIADTPPCLTSNSGKPLYPHVSGPANGPDNSPNGDMFMNYMDYTDDDTTVMFTKDQVAEMRTVLDFARKSLWSSGFSSLLGIFSTTFDAAPSNVRFTVIGGSASFSDSGRLRFSAIIPNPGDNAFNLYSSSFPRLAMKNRKDIPSAKDDIAEIDHYSIPIGKELFEGLRYVALFGGDSLNVPIDSPKHSTDFVIIDGPELRAKKPPRLLVVNSSSKPKDFVKVQIFSFDDNENKWKGERSNIDTLLPVDQDSQWTFILDDRSGFNNNLYAIKSTHTTNGKVEIHILSGEGNFNRWLGHYYTPLDEIPASEAVDFRLADWNGDGNLDVIVLHKSSSADIATRIEILAGASLYQDYLVQSATAFTQTNEDVEFAVADWTGDGRPDLIAIKNSNTASKTVEVQVLAG